MHESPWSASVYLPIDAREYHASALAWLAGSWPPAQAFFRPPLYVAFLGVVYSLLGASPVAALAVQALIGAASCVLAASLARELFGSERVALGAGVACALHGALIYYDAQLLSASLDVFLLLATLRLLRLAARRQGLRFWLLAGGAIGLSALNRGSILLFLPFALLFAALVDARRSPAARHALARGALRAAALLLPVLGALAPVAWHNATHDRAFPASTSSEVWRRIARGQFVAVAANSGINFVLGNDPALRERNRLEHPDHLGVYDRLREEPAARGIESTAEANAYLTREALRRIRAAPGAWLALEVRKLAELLNGVEVPRNTSLYADRAVSPPLAALLWRAGLAFPSGLLLPLGLLGLALSLSDWRRHALIWAALATQALFLLAFFVTARYRLPMLPLLAIYASHAAFTLWDRAREHRPAALARLLAPLALLLVLCNLPIVSVSDRHHYVDHYNLAIAYRDRGDAEVAETQLRRAAELAPEDAKTQTALCELLLDRGRAPEALGHCRAAVRSAPRDAGVLHLMGRALEATGSPVEGRRYHQQARRLEP